jgi:hypothetical protein
MEFKLLKITSATTFDVLTLNGSENNDAISVQSSLSETSWHVITAQNSAHFLPLTK